MDAVMPLKVGHRKVCTAIGHELEVHTRLEEELFYAAMDSTSMTSSPRP